MVQNGRQIDLSTQVERVRRKTRPWKSIIALLLAIAAAVISRQASQNTFTTNHVTNQFITYGTAVAFLIFGSIATYGLAGKSRQLLEPTAGPAHSAVVRYTILIVGAFTTLVITLVLFGVDVSQLVLGGAITTVFLSIAAQQALGNVFAGLVLVFARPFQVGDVIRLQAGALGGTLDGIVTDIGITYVRFDTDGRVMSIPNSQVLNAVVGPVPPEPEAAEDPEVAPDGKSGAPDGKSGAPGGPEQPQPRPAGPA